MSTQRYSVTPHPIQTLLTWVQSNEIAIPEIQRPFVWEATKVRNLLDSLYQGYPVGYLIACRRSPVRSSAAGAVVPIPWRKMLSLIFRSAPLVRSAATACCSLEDLVNSLNSLFLSVVSCRIFWVGLWISASKRLPSPDGSPLPHLRIL